MLQQALAAISIERIRKHVRSLEGIRHPMTAPAALEGAGAYMRETLAALGYNMSEQSFPDNGSMFQNVIATRSGSRYPEKRVLVVAHLDTVSTSPGADDNASGLAVLLELATILNGFRLGKSIQFIAVNLEENADQEYGGTGTRGSRALAGWARAEAWDIEGVLVLESVAFAGDSALQTAPPGLPLEVPQQGDFIAVIGNEHSRGLVQRFAQAVDRYQVPLPFLSLVVPGNGELFPDTRRSDHAPFWDHGYPAIMLTDTTNFRNPHYHQPSDTLETLNLPFAAQVCRAAAGLLLDLAGVPALATHP